jgi:DNA-binding protein HU-beta
MQLHKTDLIRKLSRKHRRSQAHYQAAFTEIFDAIRTELSNGKSITILGFGTFYSRPVKEQTLRDVRSGKQITVAPHQRVGFRPGEELRKAVKKITSQPSRGKHAR